MATNIEKFDRLAGKIFADLYESFPIPHQMTQTDYISTVVDPDGTADWEEVGEDALDAVEFYFATHRWLEKAGFIEVVTATLDGTSEVVLTNKALEALKMVPGSLAGKESLGERLTQASRDGVVDQVRSLTSQVLGAGLRLGVSTAQSVFQ